MYLKTLTIRGFKSFASKTTFDFEPGITSVIGPNGSGKSNVVDALSWVMGEQGVTNLSGGKMEDVIFSGTTALSPLVVLKSSSPSITRMAHFRLIILKSPSVVRCFVPAVPNIRSTVKQPDYSIFKNSYPIQALAGKCTLLSAKDNWIKFCRQRPKSAEVLLKKPLAFLSTGEGKSVPNASLIPCERIWTVYAISLMKSIGNWAHCLSRQLLREKRSAFSMMFVMQVRAC